MIDSWKGKNVLVTGAGGFIGFAVSDHLYLQGANVVGVVKDDTSLAISRTIRGDVSDYDFMCDAISSNEIDVIFHFAASAIVRISAKDPMSTYRNNVMGTVSVLEAARNVGRCQKILVASSDKAYGDHDVLPYKEGFALQPKNTYDTSKACADMIARSYAQNYGMPVVVTRCSNVYGPGDHNFSRIIPNTIRRIIEGKRPVLYDGIEKMEREFIFIDDVVKAYDLLARLDVPELVYNIGGTGPMRIGDLVKMISTLMLDFRDPELVQRDRTFKEIGKQYIDSSLLQRDTGWDPNEHHLQSNLAKTIEWYKAVFK